MDANRQGPPATTPKPNLGRTIISKLRVNFPDEPEAASSNTPRNTVVPEPTERRSSFLLETMKNARREPATYEVEEDDTYPEGMVPWLVDNERRDSIEQARIKLAAKGSGGSGKNKLQRDRKKLRDPKRSTSGTFFEEGRQTPEDSDKSEIAQNPSEITQEAKRPNDPATFLHPLMRTVANAEKILQEHYSIVQRDDYGSQYAGSIPSSSSQYSYSTMSDETASDSGQEQVTGHTESSSSTTLTHDVYEELNKELTALVQELELELPHKF